jgi:hypothetical protein
MRKQPLAVRPERRCEAPKSKGRERRLEKYLASHPSTSVADLWSLTYAQSERGWKVKGLSVSYRLFMNRALLC